jgi:hypothetical protein
LALRRNLLVLSGNNGTFMAAGFLQRRRVLQANLLF